MRTRNQCLVLLSIVLALAIAAPAMAQSTAPSNGAAPINTTCPVLTDEPVDPSITTTYQGHTIAFCCQRCLRKFEANPERYAANLPAFAEQDREQQGSPASSPQLRETGSPDQGHQSESSQSDEGSNASDAHEHAQEEGARDDDHPEDGRTHHEHEHPSGTSRVAALIAWLGNFHPPMVNFPIAMLVGAAVAEGLWLATKRQLFANAGRFCLWFGGLTAMTAGILGWFFGGFHFTDDSWIMTTHRWLGTATALWAFATLIVGERAYRDPTGAKRRLYRVMLSVGAAAVLVTGFFGGAMVYGISHYAW